MEIEKIKEKHTGAKTMKEKVKSAPKELIRRGLEDGTERLRLQFRDAAQQGRQDGYGGDRIEDTAAGGARQVERGVRDLLKRRRKFGEGGHTARSRPQAAGAMPSTARLHGGSLGRGRRQEAAPAERAEELCLRQAAVMRVQPHGWNIAVSKQKTLTSGGRLPLSRGYPGNSGSLLKSGTGTGKEAGGAFWAAPGPKMRPRKRGSCAPETAGIKAGSTGKAGARQAARQTVKTAENASRSTIKTAKEAVKTAHQAETTAQTTAQAAIKAPQRAAQAARLTAKTAAGTARSAARAAAAAAKAVVAAAHSLAAAIAAGGWVVIVIVLVICLVGMLIASPFGIFFADDSNGSDAVSPSAAVAQINGELGDRLTQLQESGTYDRVEVQGQPPAWSDVLAVFAAKTARAEDGVDVAVLDPERVDLLRAVFWDMTKITTTTETVEIPAGGNASASTEKVLIITVTARTPDDMRVFYSFTSWQNEALDELLVNSGMLTALAGDLTISSQDARELLANLPEDLSRSGGLWWRPPASWWEN